jgi:hypothetical protein
MPADTSVCTPRRPRPGAATSRRPGVNDSTRERLPPVANGATQGLPSPGPAQSAGDQAGGLSFAPHRARRRCAESGGDAVAAGRLASRAPRQAPHHHRGESVMNTRLRPASSTGCSTAAAVSRRIATAPCAPEARPHSPAPKTAPDTTAGLPSSASDALRHVATDASLRRSLLRPGVTPADSKSRSSRDSGAPSSCAAGRCARAR